MALGVERHGNRIRLTTPRLAWGDDEGFESQKAACKRVSGASWSKAQRCWTYPLTYGTCQELREVWGEELRIGPALWAWAAEEKVRRAELAALAKLKSVDLDRVERIAPILGAAMRDRKYQQVGAALLARAGNMLLADQPGLGKTLQSLGAVLESGIDGLNLVVAPATAVVMTWLPEVAKWLPQDTVWACSGDRKRRMHMITEAIAAPGRRWLIINPEMLEVPHWTERKVNLPHGDRVRISEASAVVKWHVQVGDEIERERVLLTVRCADGSEVPLRSPADGTLLAATVKVGELANEDSIVACVGDPEKASRVRPSKVTVQIWRDIYYHDLEREFSHVIVDESHQSLITTTGKVADQQWVRQGLGRLTVVEGGLRIAMSGTPFRGKMTNLWGTLNWLQPQRYTSYWRWIERYFDWNIDPIHGQRVIGDMLPHMAEKFYADLDPIMIRRVKAEVAPDLKPKEYAGRRLKFQTNGPAGVWLPLTPAQKKQYAQVRKDAALAVGDKTLMINGTLAEMTRLKQIASTCGVIDANDEFAPSLPSNKFDWILAWLDKHGMGVEDDGGENKVVIASQYSSVINLFSNELNRLGIPTLLITGDVTNRRRERAKADFQSAGGPRVLMLTTTAGGVSLTLDAFADDLIFVDETWVCDDQEQVEDRIHRVSRIHRTTYWYLRSLGTIEHHIATSNIEADDIQKYALDGRRGVSLLRTFVSDIEEEEEAT